VQVSIPWLKDRPEAYQARVSYGPVMSTLPSQRRTDSVEALSEDTRMALMDTYVGLNAW
jgi:hypothetical protein